MTIEQAAKIQDRNGTKYIEIPSERLSHMSGSLYKDLDNNGHEPDQEAEIRAKLQAIKVILQERAKGTIGAP